MVSEPAACGCSYKQVSRMSYTFTPTGWALEMLSHGNRNYASTCQTVGLNAGYFLSFTIFMAINSADFACVDWGRRLPPWPGADVGRPVARALQQFLPARAVRV